MTNQANWITFGINDNDIETAIHFFPYAGTISATYPIELTLTLFGSDFETVQVSMEGARLSQPDGLILKQVFPALLEEFKGHYGISISIKCDQMQLDLQHSRCITELICPDEIVRFEAKQAKEVEKTNGLGRFSDQSLSSIIVINASDKSLNNGFPPGLIQTRFNASNNLDSFSVQEYDFSNDYIRSGVEQNCSQGEFQFQSFELNPAEPELVYFTVDRSPETQYPIAVSCL